MTYFSSTEKEPLNSPSHVPTTTTMRTSSPPLLSSSTSCPTTMTRSVKTCYPSPGSLPEDHPWREVWPRRGRTPPSFSMTTTTTHPSHTSAPSSSTLYGASMGETEKEYQEVSHPPRHETEGVQGDLNREGGRGKTVPNTTPPAGGGHEMEKKQNASKNDLQKSHSTLYTVEQLMADIKDVMRSSSLVWSSTRSSHGSSSTSPPPPPQKKKNKRKEGKKEGGVPSPSEGVIGSLQMFSQRWWNAPEGLAFFQLHAYAVVLPFLLEGVEVLAGGAEVAFRKAPTTESERAEEREIPETSSTLKKSPLHHATPCTEQGVSGMWQHAFPFFLPRLLPVLLRKSSTVPISPLAIRYLNFMFKMLLMALRSPIFEGPFLSFSAPASDSFPAARFKEDTEEPRVFSGGQGLTMSSSVSRAPASSGSSLFGSEAKNLMKPKNNTTTNHRHHHHHHNIRAEQSYRVWLYLKGCYFFLQQLQAGLDWLEEEVREAYAMALPLSSLFPRLSDVVSPERSPPDGPIVEVQLPSRAPKKHTTPLLTRTTTTTTTSSSSNVSTLMSWESWLEWSRRPLTLIGFCASYVGSSLKLHPELIVATDMETPAAVARWCTRDALGEWWDQNSQPIHHMAAAVVLHKQNKEEEGEKDRVDDGKKTASEANTTVLSHSRREGGEAFPLSSDSTNTSSRLDALRSVLITAVAGGHHGLCGLLHWLSHASEEVEEKEEGTKALPHHFNEEGVARNQKEVGSLGIAVGPRKDPPRLVPPSLPHPSPLHEEGSPGAGVVLGSSAFFCHVGQQLSLLVEPRLRSSIQVLGEGMWKICTSTTTTAMVARRSQGTRDEEEEIDTEAKVEHRSPTDLRMGHDHDDHGVALERISRSLLLLPPLSPSSSSPSSSGSLSRVIRSFSSAETTSLPKNTPEDEEEEGGRSHQWRSTSLEPHRRFNTFPTRTTTTTMKRIEDAPSETWISVATLARVVAFFKGCCGEGGGDGNEMIPFSVPPPTTSPLEDGMAVSTPVVASSSSSLVRLLFSGLVLLWLWIPGVRVETVLPYWKRYAQQGSRRGTGGTSGSLSRWGSLGYGTREAVPLPSPRPPFLPLSFTTLERWKNESDPQHHHEEEEKEEEVVRYDCPSWELLYRTMALQTRIPMTLLWSKLDEISVTSLFSTYCTPTNERSTETKPTTATGVAEENKEDLKALHVEETPLAVQWGILLRQLCRTLLSVPYPSPPHAGVQHNDSPSSLHADTPSTGVPRGSSTTGRPPLDDFHPELTTIQKEEVEEVAADVGAALFGLHHDLLSHWWCSTTTRYGSSVRPHEEEHHEGYLIVSGSPFSSCGSTPFSGRERGVEPHETRKKKKKEREEEEEEDQHETRLPPKRTPSPFASSGVAGASFEMDDALVWSGILKGVWIPLCQWVMHFHLEEDSGGSGRGGWDLQRSTVLHPRLESSVESPKEEEKGHSERNRPASVVDVPLFSPLCASTSPAARFVHAMVHTGAMWLQEDDEWFHPEPTTTTIREEKRGMKPSIVEGKEVVVVKPHEGRGEDSSGVGGEASGGGVKKRTTEHQHHPHQKRRGTMGHAMALCSLLAALLSTGAATALKVFPTEVSTTTTSFVSLASCFPSERYVLLVRGEAAWCSETLKRRTEFHHKTAIASPQGIGLTDSTSRIRSTPLPPPSSSSFTRSFLDASSTRLTEATTKEEAVRAFLFLVDLLWMYQTQQRQGSSSLFSKEDKEVEERMETLHHLPPLPPLWHRAEHEDKDPDGGALLSSSFLSSSSRFWCALPSSLHPRLCSIWLAMVGRWHEKKHITPPPYGGIEAIASSSSSSLWRSLQKEMNSTNGIQHLLSDSFSFSSASAFSLLPVQSYLSCYLSLCSVWSFLHHRVDISIGSLHFSDDVLHELSGLLRATSFPSGPSSLTPASRNDPSVEVPAKQEGEKEKHRGWRGRERVLQVLSNSFSSLSPSPSISSSSFTIFQGVPSSPSSIPPALLGEVETEKGEEEQRGGVRPQPTLLDLWKKGPSPVPLSSSPSTKDLMVKKEMPAHEMTHERTPHHAPCMEEEDDDDDDDVVVVIDGRPGIGTGTSDASLALRDGVVASSSLSSRHKKGYKEANIRKRERETDEDDEDDVPTEDVSCATITTNTSLCAMEQMDALTSTLLKWVEEEKNGQTEKEASATRRREILKKAWDRLVHLGNAVMMEDGTTGGPSRSPSLPKRKPKR